MDGNINKTPRLPMLTLCRQLQKLKVHIQDHFLVHSNPLEPSKNLLLKPSGNIRTPHESLSIKHMLSLNSMVFNNTSQQQ
jgi:hypothetical protein